MNAISPQITGAQEAGRPSFGHSATNATGMRWAALSDAANVVSVLAGLEAERPAPEIRNFPALIRDAEEWRRQRAEDGVADLAAIMEPGIAALLAVTARGADPRPAALSLLQEFNAARGALLALLPASGAMGPRRTA